MNHNPLITPTVLWVRALERLPPTILSRSSIEALHENIGREINNCEDNIQKMTFLFSSVSTIYQYAPTWMKSLDVLHELGSAIRSQSKELLSLQDYLSKGHTLDSVADIFLLNIIGINPKLDVNQNYTKDVALKDILRSIRNSENAVAPYANTLRTVYALRKKHIVWVELDIIERSITHALKEMIEI